MSDLQENTEFLNSYHPVDLNRTLLYTAGRSDRRLTEQFFDPRYIYPWGAVNRTYGTYRTHSIDRVL